MWGNQKGGACRPSFLRFTPTRVGKSRSRFQVCLWQTVHPHTCGEIRCRWANGCGVVGSPPHVWGNRSLLGISKVRGRFTPTRVGKSVNSPSGLLVKTVHPHTCGEINCRRSSFNRTTGSPPHVWGNPTPKTATGPATRFTPTRVGKSLLHHAIARVPSVHPHTCGEI